MSLAIALHLEKQKVLIVGGGNVAFRKVQQVLNEGAVVDVLAPSIIEQIQNTTANCIYKRFEAQDLAGYFLVYAATDDKKVNEEVVRLANKQNILCGSATKSKEVRFSSLQQETLPHGLMAISTLGLAPGMTKEMTAVLKEIWDTTFEAKLQLLDEIRQMLKDKYQLVRKTISTFSYQKLMVVYEILQKQKVIVCLYHGVKDRQVMEQDIPAFLNRIHLPDYVKVSCACFTQANQNDGYVDTFSLDEILCLAKQLSHIAFSFEILMMQKGYCYQKLVEQCSGYGKILSFWLPKEALEMYIKYHVERQKNKTCYFILHNRYEDFQMLCEKYGALCCDVKQKKVFPKSKRLHVIPVFFTKGKHMCEDVLYGEHSICEQARQKGYEVTYEETALIEQKISVELLQNSLDESLNFK